MNTYRNNRPGSSDRKPGRSFNSKPRGGFSDRPKTDSRDGNRDEGRRKNFRGPARSNSSSSSAFSSSRSTNTSSAPRSSFGARSSDRSSAARTSDRRSSSTSYHSSSRPASRGGFGGGSRGGYRGSSSTGGSRGGARGGSRGGSSRGGSRGGNRGGGRRKTPSFNPSQFINQNPVKLAAEVYVAKHTFNDFGLNSELVKTIDRMGIKTPSPIQDQIIPIILEGKDVVGLAETGTGKTAAFLVPVIEKTLKDNRRKTLILTPTRELALQVNGEFIKLSRNLKMFSTTCVGGMNIRPQMRSLQRRNHFIIGTPGRILDLIKRKSLRTDDITTVVLDEADRMLDMGFIHDIRKIISSIPTANRETLFFSATMADDVKGLVKDFLKDPVTISVKKQDVTNSIEQDVVFFNNQNKFDLLTKMLETPDFKRVLIFGSMKHSVEKLSQELKHHGINAESIHGNKNHAQRQRALNNFKDGIAKVLVATDVAARGIHVDRVTHVINYDLPTSFTDYVHRIGRTGRGDSKGKALTFIPDHM